MTKSWILVCLLYLFIPLVSSKGVAGQSLSFRKVNPGTRADIRALAADKTNNLYFLTDGIHLLRGDTWVKMDFPVEGKIFAFCPVSADDIWFSVTPVTSTSLLYHYYESKTENIRTPFSNFISNIFFVSENSALFASWQICYDLVKNGYSDWFLPSRDELKEMYLQRNVIGGFSAAFYYSSSGYDENEAYFQDFGAWPQETCPKQNTGVALRAIREF